MAKEWHNWGRYIFLAIVIVFTCGGYVLQITSNTGKIEKNSEKIEVGIEKVHKLEIKQEREIALKEALLGSINEIKSGVIKGNDIYQQMQTGMAAIQIDVAVMKAKMETLTKD